MKTPVRKQIKKKKKKKSNVHIAEKTLFFFNGIKIALKRELLLIEFSFPIKHL